MTAYAACAIGGSSTAQEVLSISPVSYEVRIIGTFSYGTSSGGTSGAVGTYAAISSGTSGGTSVTPTAVRVGSSAASTTCKANPTSLGTPSYMWFGLASGNGGATFDGTTTEYTSGGLGSWQPPTDLIIAPGSSFLVSINASNMDGVVIIWFEELRLSWPY